jgi:uncharacterized protein (TIGR01777 family)
VKVAVTGASGFLGRPLVQRLSGAGHEVLQLRRDFGPDALTGVEAVINLAGAPVARRWTRAHKESIRESRLSTTQRLVEAAKQAGSVQRFVSTSAVGYYGAAGDEALDEGSRPGSDFLAQVCVAWEAEAAMAQALGIPTAVLRLGMVLHPAGGALVPLLRQFRLGVGGAAGSGHQYVSWIHREDALRLYVYALEHREMTGAFNGTSPNPVTNGAFAQALGRALHRPARLPAPGFALRAMLGEMATMILTGQRVLPKRTQAAGFSFEYPELNGALVNLLRPSARPD